MELKYNFSVPEDWDFEAKDYFLMGRNPNGGVGGVGEDIVGVVDIFGAEIPTGAARAWKTTVSAALSAVSLMNTSWEDVVVRVRLQPKMRVSFQMDILLPSGEYQTLYSLVILNSFYMSKDRFQLIDKWERINPALVNSNNIPTQITVSDPGQAGLLLVASDYYSPTYRPGMGQDATSAYIGVDPDGGTVVKRRLYCEKTDDCVNGVWNLAMVAPEVSEEYVTYHTPLDMEEDEARVFFGHIREESIVSIVTKLWKKIKNWFSSKSDIKRYGV